MKKTANIVLGIPVGIVVSLVVMAMAFGGFELALTLIGVSIYCTAGMALVIWVPIWWLIGWGILTLVNRSKGNQPPSIPKDSPQIQAVRSFISTARSHGESEKAIDKKLLAAGWPKAVIDSARSGMK